MKEVRNIQTKLHAAGLRATPKRLALLAVLSSLKTPATAEEMHAKVSDMDLVTIYRNVQAFVKTGMVAEVRFRDASVRYELVHTHAHHHHLVCSFCGAVEDIAACPSPQIEKEALRMSKKFRSVQNHALELFGTCVKCA